MSELQVFIQIINSIIPNVVTTENAVQVLSVARNLSPILSKAFGYEFRAPVMIDESFRAKKDAMMTLLMQVHDNELRFVMVDLVDGVCS